MTRFINVFPDPLTPRPRTTSRLSSTRTPQKQFPSRRNNIFAYCGVAGLSRGTETGIPDEVNQFSRNILYMEHPVMARGAVSPSLSTFNHQLYWNRRPPLNAVFIDGSIDGDGTRASDESDATGRELGQAESSVVADPGFVNPEQRDFRLKPGSPAKKIGFVPFDFSDAGLYGDPAWTARPAKLTHRPLETVEPDWLGFRYDFEDHHAGMMPMTCLSVGEKNGCTVRVSTDRAASGTKSMLFEDGADAPSYFPMLTIKRGYADGRYRLSLKLWQDPANPAELSLQTRSYMGATSLTGVRVRIGPDPLTPRPRTTSRLSSTRTPQKQFPSRHPVPAPRPGSARPAPLKSNFLAERT